ncbi:DUF218 domain-containing protein [Asanoa hainanensis]|uniref:DUF218 domain-containing protein n=1 Tax=Asanoa hainanensis TaxID=560556 RepID=A0A239H088_9ACTN|nr:ElyC/SanA/YdcF family protein [Asanoa hainanensis]SNS74886.1 DUF218 domain-containing protein [Asanoa hainanensis]
MVFHGAAPRVLSGVDRFPAGRLLEVVDALTVVLSLPQAAADRVDALVVATGQGEEWRLTHAIRLWESNPRLRTLLVANGNPAEATYAELTVDYLRGLGLTRVDGVDIQAEAAPNTGLQAAWIVERVRALGITSLAVTVSAYHLLRVYLTVLRAMSDDGVRIPLIPVPAAIAPGARVPETGATAYELIPGEVDRILTYADRGFLATPAELREYLAWLWRQHRSLLVG